MSEEMKCTPEPLVASVGLGVPTRLGDRRCGGGGYFEPELPEVAPRAVLTLTRHSKVLRFSGSRVLGLEGPPDCGESDDRRACARRPTWSRG